MGRLEKLLHDLSQGTRYLCPACGHSEDCSSESSKRWEFWKGLERREHDVSLDHQPGGSDGLAVVPKGSPQRKAAVREERRKLAAVARAKKAAKARLASGEPGGLADGTAADDADDGIVGDQKLSYREVIEWVWDSLSKARCPPAPSRKARELWRYAKRNRDWFLDKYVPMLIRREKDEKKEPTEQEREKVAIGDARKRVLEFLTPAFAGPAHFPSGPSG
jgi:hypothetical protein